MLKGIFGGLGAYIANWKENGREGPYGLTLTQTEGRRQDNIKELFETALGASKSTNQIDVWHSIQEQLGLASGRGNDLHEYGEITENDVISFWSDLPDYRKGELRLIEMSESAIEGGRLWHQQCEERDSIQEVDEPVHAGPKL